jgi:hypothetical protein
MFVWRRLALAIVFLLPAWALLSLGLCWLPSWIAMSCLFAGLTLFLVGSDREVPWCVGVGGVLMFAGVFAAAMRGALG